METGMDVLSVLDSDLRTCLKCHRIFDRDRIAPILGTCGHLQCLSCINAEENPGILFGTNAKCARCVKVGVFKTKMKAICIVDMVETYQSLKLKSNQSTFAWRAREINLNRQLENKENEIRKLTGVEEKLESANRKHQDDLTQIRHLWEQLELKKSENRILEEANQELTMKNGEKDLKIKQLEEKMDKLQSRLDKLLTIEELRDENENKTLSSLFDDANDNLDEWKEYRSQWQEYGKEIEEWKEILKKPNELKLEDLPEIQQFKEWAREKEKGYEKADANDAENNAKKKSRRQQNKQSNHDNVDPTKVFIRNIGSSVTKEILRDKFSAWGQIEFVFVGYDRQTNAHLSYGWVRYKNAESARQAIQMMHNTYICGDQISVKPGLINPPSKKTE